MGNIIRKSAYLRLLLPAVLTAILVYDGLMGYTAPDPFDGIELAEQPSYAAEIPELETVEQAEKTTPEPQGTAGRLAAVKDPGSYEDGTYTGSARGFGGTITVKVTIRNGKIASVNVVSAPGETGSFLARAKAVTGRILKKQSTNVDAVSGATYSSNGIIKAVRNALAKAAGKKSGKDKKPSGKDDGTPENQDDNRKPEKPETVTEGSWIDGKYTGEGEGFSGKLHVEVVIKDGKIVSVRLLDSKDDRSFMDKAKKAILKAVTDKQSTDVDAVSGATFSSYGLLEAINDALKQASAQSDTDGKGNKDDEEKPEPSDNVSLTRTGWVLYDDDEDFDDYQLTVTFTEQGNRITSIAEYSQTGPATNNPYIRMAVQGINKQLSAGTDPAEIDAVTGATCTSSSILEMMAGIASEERAGEDEDEKSADGQAAEDAKPDNKADDKDDNADNKEDAGAADGDTSYDDNSADADDTRAADKSDDGGNAVTSDDSQGGQVLPEKAEKAALPEEAAQPKEDNEDDNKEEKEQKKAEPVPGEDGPQD